MILLWDTKSEEPLDERSRSLLKRLLDEATPHQQAFHPHADPILPAAPTPSSDQNPKEAPKMPPSPALAPADVTRMEPPRPVESGGRHPLLFLAKPPSFDPERPTKQKPPDHHTRHPRSRGLHTRQMGLLPPRQPPGSPFRKAGDSRRTTAPDARSPPADRSLTRPRAAASWAIVPANPAQAAVRQERSHPEDVGLSIGTPGWGPLGSETMRVGPPTRRLKAEPRASASTFPEPEGGKDGVARGRHGRANGSGGPGGPRRRLRDGHTNMKDSLDQTAIITKQRESPDRRYTAQIARSSSARDCPACAPSRRAHRKQIYGNQGDTPDQTVFYPRLMNLKADRVSFPHQSRPRQRERSLRREPTRRSSSETSRRPRPRPMPARRASSSSSSACCSHGAALPTKPRRRTAATQDSVGPVTLFKQRSTRRGTIPTRCDSPSELMIPRRNPPARRPVVPPPRSKAGKPTAIAEAEHLNENAVTKDGRLRRLKNRLGLVFHHQHHHYHHHHPPPDENKNRGGARRDRRQHRSLGQLLRGIFHHEGGKRAAEGGRRRPPPQKGQRHGYLHMLLEGLLRHLFRVGKRRKQRPPKPGGAARRLAAKKLHWWQRIRRRRRGLGLGSRRRPRLRLGFGRKASVVGRGGSKMKQ